MMRPWQIKNSLSFKLNIIWNSIAKKRFKMILDISFVFDLRSVYKKKYFPTV